MVAYAMPSQLAITYRECSYRLVQLSFARHNGGEFIIRVEDTDTKRNLEDGEDLN